MPLDIPLAQALQVDASELHGVARHLLVRHVMAGLNAEQRRALMAVELTDAGCFVNMGMNFDRVAWRAVWRLPSLPEAGGTIPVWKGAIAG